MPMLECPELAELDLEPVAGSYLHQQQQQHHHPHHAPLPTIPTSVPAIGAAASTSKPKYNVRKAVKLESDLNHHELHQQNENHHPHLGVRPMTKFKHILSEPSDNTWMSIMDIHAQQHHIHQQQQQQHLQHHQQQQSHIQLEDTKKVANPDPKNSSSIVESRRYYPAPYCSCTGANQQCYRWGNGGWQSACCTTKISVYPLPMNPKKKGSRVAGRKMSAGAFRKLLDRLSSEGVDVNLAVDLRPHWAKHGTNRYVTIK